MPPVLNAIPVAIALVLLSPVLPARADVEAAGEAMRLRDYATGIRLMTAAAERGEASAAALLAEIYELGLGTQRDADLAARWRRSAAEQGDAESAYRVGRRFAAGDGTARDDEAARRWFRIAAEKGHAPAQLELSKLLGASGATDAQVEESRRWYERAMNAGAVPSRKIEDGALMAPRAAGPTLTDLRDAARRKRLPLPPRAPAWLMPGWAILPVPPGAPPWMGSPGGYSGFGIWPGLQW
ncbi:MAG: tetratricopeptide repeat protein [Burkholderiales bacterium]